MPRASALAKIRLATPANRSGISTGRSRFLKARRTSPAWESDSRRDETSRFWSSSITPGVGSTGMSMISATTSDDQEFR